MKTKYVTSSDLRVSSNKAWSYWCVCAETTLCVIGVHVWTMQWTPKLIITQQNQTIKWKIAYQPSMHAINQVMPKLNSDEDIQAKLQI